MQIVNFPTALWIGQDSFEGLRQREEKSVFVVTDPFVKQSGLLDLLLQPLANKTVCVFSDIVPDPPVSIVTAGVASILEHKPDLLIAVGGGSAIDAAKAMYYFSGKLGESTIKTFIAVPTTSGTGSEVTNFSVITLESAGIKYPLVTNEIQPHIAILNPVLIESVPPAITADTGMDVLSHLVEAYVSTTDNVMADVFIEYAVPQVFTYLKMAYNNGNDMIARANMHFASCLAGMAFNSRGLGLVHGLSHALGGQFHLPHGRLNAMLLPHVIAYNADIENPRGPLQLVALKYAKLAKLSNPSVLHNHRAGTMAFIKQIQQLQRALRIPKTLTECGIDRQAVIEAKDSIIQATLRDSCTSTNPRKPTAEDIGVLLQRII